MGVRIVTRTVLAQIRPDHVDGQAVIDGAPAEFPCTAVLLVADRTPNTALHDEILGQSHVGGADSALDSVHLIGDAQAPGLIAQVVFSGHRAARQFGEEIDIDAVEFLREG